MRVGWDSARNRQFIRQHVVLACDFGFYWSKLHVSRHNPSMPHSPSHFALSVSLPLRTEPFASAIARDGLDIFNSQVDFTIFNLKVDLEDFNL
jgi:hypothetical protein